MRRRRSSNLRQGNRKLRTHAHLYLALDRARKKALPPLRPLLLIATISLPFIRIFPCPVASDRSQGLINGTFQLSLPLSPHNGPFSDTVPHDLTSCPPATSNFRITEIWNISR